MAKAQRFLLPDIMNSCELTNCLDFKEQILLALLLQDALKFHGLIEVVLYRFLVAAGYDNDALNSGLHRFFHNILNRRLVDDRQHFFGLCFGCRQEAGAESSGGNYSFSDFHMDSLLFFFVSSLLSEHKIPASSIINEDTYCGSSQFAEGKIRSRTGIQHL
ncbi:hypothetical protein D3C72_1741300 [compost metagenome]